MTARPWEACAVGAKARLVYECPTAAQGVRPVLPLLVARGARPGPLLLTIACQHGRELHGPAGIARVFAELDPTQLAGTAVFLPLINPLGPRMHQQDYPFEGFRYREGLKANWNMNRTWGLGYDNYSGAISTAVATAFVDHADAVVDLHGWGSVSTVWGPTRDRDFVLSFGLRINVLRPPATPTIPGMLEGYVEARGTPFLLAELAPQNTLDPVRVKECHVGLLNVLRHLDMLAGDLELPAEQLVFPMDGTETLLESAREGLCEPLVAHGDLVAEGDLLARTWSLEDFAVIEEFRAPHAGAIGNLLSFRWGEDVPAGAVVHPGTPVVLVRADPEIRRPDGGRA